MGNNAFDDLKKRAREDAYADIRQWMFWLPLTPNELTIEITYRFLRKRGCPAYLAKTIASK